MRNNLPASSNTTRMALLGVALAVVPFVVVGCATVAGFEDFSSKGKGGSGATAGVDGSGGGFVVNGGESSTGGETGATGGSAMGGFQATGGASATLCGAVGQRCCALTPSCSNSCCYNGTCVASGTFCGNSNNTCQPSGHCQNCGQTNQACCGSGFCEYGNECSGGTCRTCGANGQSCCENIGFPACGSGAVCVSASGSSQNQCASNCGALNQACCTGASFTGAGCEISTTLFCSNGSCRNPTMN